MSNESIREKSGRNTRRPRGESRSGHSCCSSSCCGSTAPAGNPITSNLYARERKRRLPAEAVAASLGCGNPTALAELKPGETVLDLGSGGGIDVLLSARRSGRRAKPTAST